MSFDSHEISIADGKPARLYLFERGALKWGYTSADRYIVYEGVTYRDVAISDDGIRQSGEASADAFTVTAPSSLEVAHQYRILPPSAEVFLTVFDLHFPELLARMRWTGSLQGVGWPEPDRCEITCRSWLASLDETGLRQTYTRGCPHSLYDHRCSVNKDVFKVTAMLSAVTAVSVSAAVFDGFADGYFTGGFLEFELGSGEVERRGIETHAGAVLSLLDLAVDLAAGMTVSVYPGCNRTIAVCNSKFGNKDNYGGQPHQPGKSPFSGDPIF